MAAGLDGLRILLLRLEERRKSLVRNIAEKHQSEWNVLFPGSFPDAVSLAVLAATCSERRLHAESEQVFRVITAATRAVDSAATAGPLTVVFRDADRLDLPTLRAIPHLCERIALSGAQLTLVLAGLGFSDSTSGTGGGNAGACVEERRAIRRRHLDAVMERLGVELQSEETPERPRVTVQPRATAASAPPSRERELLNALASAGVAEAAVAAAIGLMRTAFFSTNHDTGVFAAHRLLEELERSPGLETDRVRELVAAMELGDDPGSVGVDASAVTGHDALRSLAYRYLGVVHVFVLDYATALRQLRAAADLGPGTVRSRARLLSALLLIKRVGRVQDGFAEVAAGLEGLAGDTSDTAAVEAAWLHNVRALGHVQLRDLKSAMAEERAAVRLIGKLTTTDATHLKVNLVSNISVLREYARQPEAAVEAWRRFSQHSDGWGDTFFKHHSYREGGLLVAAGAVNEALPLLDRSYRLAEYAGDHFYRAHMALERGRLLLGREPGEGRDEAAEAFAQAEQHAIALGDPFLLALATLGDGLASGTLADPSEGGEGLRRRTVDLARASTSYAEQSARLIEVVAQGSEEESLACLPGPRSKLNRPFFTVRLTLPELV